jgi:proline iminopeptidase
VRGTDFCTDFYVKPVTVDLTDGFGELSRVCSEEMFNWCATKQERRQPLPADNLILEARGSSTHAITIGAKAQDVWPWLVQMGCGRAGWYSYDRLDNGGTPSARRILPEFQKLDVGDILPSRPNQSDGFEVLRIESPQLLVLGAYFNLSGLRSLPWEDAPPRAYLRSSWVFLLRSAEQKQTRLIVRARAVLRPKLLQYLVNSFAGPAHVIMQRRQLLNLKIRAERSPH